MIHTTGHDKEHFTVVLAAMADGHKLNPYVVFKGVRPKVEKGVWSHCKNGKMNKGLSIDWVKRGWGTLSFGRRLLVLDAYKCHLMSTVEDIVDKEARSDTCISVIPGGLK